jgi:hypothetical protein
MPAAIAALAGKKSRCEIMEPDRHLIQDFIRRHALLISSF